ncbi:neutral zinc metallopeptidase [Cellulomonas sp. zg-ZUI222]|uniref:Neutral zinc metallopeptidase n=1 Tax=Cellulomonas wangleii TaxID=2816956 RepID=A0ABX8DAF4_9CELL|nr:MULTISPECIES: neutral zinc metallopeptidase [Cellulomonas]MBO0900537.1 neutral zinc metallopeptidase [Cellulomonas sp. zg-ZUI22]MBO0922633.1 neutral zinc metallopeptidase [Cellulomonas wangleii]MBO0926502.1 neutral zinc metallopeptidase [Cellulomonas wangleii]QVI63835.1 neutral zinc metallopeptidase [Cellulomonas wangleii]
MTFSEGGRFEGGRVKRHGRGGAVAAGGGGLVGIIALAIFLFTGQDVSGVLGAEGGGASAPVDEVGECTAEQANTDPLCRYSATLEALEVYWGATVPAGTAFAPAQGHEFSGGIATGCGQASSSTGPFYCPADQGIYLDVTFFDLLQQQLGAQGGPLAEMYIYAHEYGHHIQNLTGVFDSADRGGSGAESDSVRVELQADCYAGMWVGDAATREDPETGVTYLQPPTREELAQALDAAATVGDDHIQQQSGGVNPDTWTHGSSEQRQKWFTIGYEQGSLAACDTFAASEL